MAKKSTMKKYSVNFTLYGTIILTARNERTAENKAYRIPIKELIKKSKSIDRDSINMWEADKVD